MYKVLIVNFKNFLLNKSKDHNGRKLMDIVKFSDSEIESTHDFIQLIFPLDEPSNLSSNIYFIDSKLHLKNLQKNDLVKNKLIELSNWFINFLKRQNHWMVNYNHNHLRITRMIKSIRLIVGDKEANDIYNKIINIKDIKKKVGKKSLEYWKNA